MKETLLTILLLFAGWLGYQPSFGAPSNNSNVVRNIIPESGSTYYNGSSTSRWLGTETVNSTSTGSSNVNGSRCFDGTSCIDSWASISSLIGGKNWEATSWGTDLTPTSTSAGIFVNASSTINANFRVSGNATTTGTSYFQGLMSIGGVPDTMTVNGSLISSNLAVDSDTQGIVELHTHSDTANNDSTVYGARSRGTGLSQTVVQDNDRLFTLGAVGYDGTDFALSSRVDFEVDGTPGNNDMPGRISFKTSADGGQSSTEKLRITSTSTHITSNTLISGNATTTDLGVERVVEFKELSATQSTPSTGRGQVYVRDEAGDQGLYFLSELGVESLLGGAGSGGCTDLPCLVDVDDALAFTSGHYFRANGSAFTNSALLASDLSGTVAVANGGTSFSSYSIGDILYATAAGVLSKLNIGTDEYVLTAEGTGLAYEERMDLTSNQTVASGIKTFAVPPRSNQSADEGDELVTFTQLSGLGTSQIYKDSVTAATTTSLTLSGVQNVDVGVTGVSGDRVLMAGQSSSSANGCYTQAAGAWTRCTDYDAAAEVLRGTSFPVEGGTFNQGKIFIMNSPSVTTLGTDPITFASLPQITVTGGDGITVSSNEVSVDFATDDGFQFTGGQLAHLFNNSITANASGLAVNTTSPFVWTGTHSWSALTTFTDARPAVLNATSTNIGTLNVYGNTTLSTVTGAGLGDCDGASNALIWDVTSSQFGCNTITGGAGGAAGATATSTAFLHWTAEGGANSAWTNMPAAETVLFGSAFSNHRVDLVNATGYFISVNQAVAGSANAQIWLQYSTNGSTWVNATSTGVNGRLNVGTGTGNKITGYLELPSAAKVAGVYLRLIGSAGNGTADPAFRNIQVQFERLINVPSSQAWHKFTGVASPADIITPTTTAASIYISGNATTTGGFTADAGTLFVDAGNNRVGILDLSPQQALTVGSGELFTVDSSGNASTTGYLNIGKNNAGRALASGELWVSTNATTTGNLTVDSTTLVVQADTNRVGIGTTAPEGLLEVQGADATAASFYLDADRGDDAADTWIISSQTDNDLQFTQGTVDLLELSNFGGTTNYLNIDSPLGINFQDNGTSVFAIDTANAFFYDNIELGFGNDIDYVTGFDSSESEYRIVDGGDITSDSNARLTLTTDGFFGVNTTTHQAAFTAVRNDNPVFSEPTGLFYSTGTTRLWIEGSDTTKQHGIRLGSGAETASMLIDGSNGDMKFYNFSGSEPDLRIDSNGKLVVGTSTAITTGAGAGWMEIVGDKPTVQFNNTAAGDSDFFISVDADRMAFGVGTKGSATGEPFTIEDDGDVTVGDQLTITNIAASAFTETLCWDAAGASLVSDCTSLSKFKANIADLTLGLETVLKLKPRVFNWHKDPVTGETDFTKIDPELDLGFIAEEVEEVDPLLASYTGEDNELTGVKYERLTALLTKAIQELWGNFQMLFSWNTDQDLKIKELEQQNANLLKRIEALESQ